MPTPCCAKAAHDDLRDRDVAFMRVLARLLADAIEHPPVGGGWGLHIVRQMARGLTVARPAAGGVAVAFELELAA